jgi:kinesin family protein 4/21/27
MGSGYTIGLKSDELGIIPRVIKLIFEEVDKRKLKAEFIIKCTFLEIYNEELHDLLDHGVLSSGMSSITGSVSSSVVMDRFMQKKEITIREEKNGNISVYGLREEKVTCYEELAACLDRGSNFRSTASTLMNNCSSRSHAIFTISIEQHIIEDLYKADGV